MIQKGEFNQIIKWTFLWVFSWFVAFNLREIITPYFPTSGQQLVVGIIGLFAVIYIWDIRKYSGLG